MANEGDLAEGWTLEEALRHLVPDAWREWEQARDKWPSRKPRRGIVSDAYGLVPPSPEYIEKKSAWDAATKAWRNLHSAFVEVMRHGQNKTIILPNDVSADRQLMPSAQWRNVKRLDPENSRIEYKKGEWLLVRIFPAEGARQMATDTNLVTRPVKLTLAEAFRKNIVDSPVIKDLLKTAADASSGTHTIPAVYVCGSSWPIGPIPILTTEWHFYDDEEWGLKLAPDGFTDADSKFLRGIADEYNSMISPLRSGSLEAWGHLAGGSWDQISRAIWSSGGYFVDLTNNSVGKFREPQEYKNEPSYVPIWTGVMLQSPSASTSFASKEVRGENLYSLLYKAITAIENPKQYFSVRGKKIEFARNFHSRHPRYELESVKRIANDVRKDIGKLN